MAVVQALLGSLTATYRPWLRSLPHRTRRLVIGAGGLYVAGALGLEVTARFYETAGGSRSSLFEGVFSATEELLEMIGAALFIFALLGCLTAVGLEVAAHSSE